jgi:hypothetical protein
MLLYIYGWDELTIQSPKPHMCVARWWLKKLETGSCKILSRNTKLVHRQSFSHVMWARAGGERPHMENARAWVMGVGAAPLSHCHSALHTFCSLPLHPLAPSPCITTASLPTCTLFYLHMHPQQKITQETLICCMLGNLGPLCTRSYGWKNLGPTLSIFGLLFGPSY